MHVLTLVYPQNAKRCILLHIITLTKQRAIHSQAAIPATAGVGAPARSNKADPPALRFSSAEDAINFARDGIEDSNRRSGRDAVKLVKRYVEGELHIVLKLAAGVDHREYDLIFFAVKEGGNNPYPTGHDSFIDHHASAVDANGHQEPVFIGVTQFVQGPEGVIPSFMWLERAKERADIRRQIFAPALNVRIEVNNTVPEGKVSILRLSDASPHGDGIPALIETGSERFYGLNRDVCPTIGDFAVKLKGMDSHALRIDFSDVVTWFTFEEGGDTLFKPTDICLCAG